MPTAAEQLEALLAQLTALPAEQQQQALDMAHKATAHMPIVPNPGVQTDVYLSPADEIYLAGGTGGGKSYVMFALALTEHKRSLILRRFRDDARKMSDELGKALGTTEGHNGQRLDWRRPDGRLIEFGGCANEADKQRYKGSRRDLMAFDEVSDFTETQYTFIIGWNGSPDPKQRCRVIASGNPPTTAEGMWVVRRWAPWLDPQHPNPAEIGELRWFTTIDGKDTEVDGPGPHIVPGEPRPVMARSRTFYRADLDDNPELSQGNYDATRAALPADLRDIYRKGSFESVFQDRPKQLIPTRWVRDAMDRWTPEPPAGAPMCVIAADIAQGGPDRTVLAARYDGWYDKLDVHEGKETPTGREVAGLVVSRRRDAATVVLDFGGGWAGGAYECLRDNEIDIVAFKGSEGSKARSRDGKLRFVNKRSEAYYKFMEALDPEQEGGSPVYLPDDRVLLADLTAIDFEVTPHGVKVTPKDVLVKTLGRSPDRGDAVVMAWLNGDYRAARRMNPRPGEFGHRSARAQPPQTKAIMGHQHQRRSR